MALWTKFREMNPETQHSKATLGGLAKWASEQQLLPSHLNAGALVHLRNSFAHPKEFSVVLTPGMAVDAFRLLVEVVNHLWPLDLA
jgi:hypothetical protein